MVLISFEHCNISYEIALYFYLHDFQCLSFQVVICLLDFFIHFSKRQICKQFIMNKVGNFKKIYKIDYRINLKNRINKEESKLWLELQNDLQLWNSVMFLVFIKHCNISYTRSHSTSMYVDDLIQFLDPLKVRCRDRYERKIIRKKKIEDFSVMQEIGSSEDITLRLAW